jgi:hypothetical protein
MRDTPSLEERMSRVERDVAEMREEFAGMRGLFGRWLESQVAIAKQATNRPQQMPGAAVDDQLVMINARAPQRQAKGLDAPVKFGDAGLDVPTDRINSKRRELLGAKK